jgi:uncharacterized protein YndB with AHSA1/START domain
VSEGATGSACSRRTASFSTWGEFREVDAPNRLVYTFVWEDPTPYDQETVVTLSFGDLGRDTALVLDKGPVRHRGSPCSARRRLDGRALRFGFRASAAAGEYDVRFARLGEGATHGSR